MTNHLNDADLVALALLPDEPADARMHLAACPQCQSRLDVAETEIRRQREAHESSIEDRDATFWKRQELSVMREISRSSRSGAGSVRSGFVAAAIVSIAIGGFWFGRSSVEPTRLPEVTVPVASSTPTSLSPEREVLVPTTTVSTDPWDAETLNEFQAVVDWESWVDEEGKEQGTI